MARAFTAEAKILLHPLDSGTRYGDGTLDGIGWRAMVAHLMGHCGEKAFVRVDHAYDEK
jgi:hypothetical protein